MSSNVTRRVLGYGLSEGRVVAIAVSGIKGFASTRREEDANLAIKMWVDSDALPTEIKEIVLRASRRLSVETVFVANKNVWVRDDPLVSFVRVTEGLDIADDFIVEASAPGDFCVTADIPLAARLVDKG